MCDLVPAFAARDVPVLGVCLGHQAIGQHFGGKVERGGLMHGKTSPVLHDDTGLYHGLPSPFTATRYHSLIVNAVPDTLVVNATAQDGTVMGFRHATLPIHGVQFHPESIATEHGHAMLANFLRIAGLPVTSSPILLAGGVGGGQSAASFVPPVASPPLTSPASGSGIA